MRGKPARTISRFKTAMGRPEACAPLRSPTMKCLACALRVLEPMHCHHIMSVTLPSDVERWQSVTPRPLTSHLCALSESEQDALQVVSAVLVDQTALQWYHSW